VTATRRLAATAVVWTVSFAALRVTFLAPEECEPAPAADLLDGAEAAGDWIARAQGTDGRYVYEYDRGEDRIPPGYNIVRHAGVTMSLYQLARAGRLEFVDVGDESLEVLLDMLGPAGDGSAVLEGGSARLGASALTAAALAQRRDATGDPRYDVELRALGRFMAGQITAGGQMLAVYDTASGRPVPGETSRYATGEAAWALAQLHNLFPGEGWDEPARTVLDYLATRRDEEEDLVPKPWPDQWAAYTLAELAPSGLDEQQRSYLRDLAARIGMLLRTEAQKDAQPFPFVDHRARAAGLGVWVEGMAGLAAASRTEGRDDDLVERMQTRRDCGAALLLDRQVDEHESTRWPSPGLVQGAWFRDDITRMDDQQHALSALLAAAGALGPVGQ
jgi:hypothetical protein